MDIAAVRCDRLFYEEGSFGVFLLVTVILGGGAAALAGRAIAETWRPWWQVVAYMLILGGAVRFIHFACSAARCCRCIIMSSTARSASPADVSAFATPRAGADGRAISLDQRAGRSDALAPQAALT